MSVRKRWMTLSPARSRIATGLATQARYNARAMERRRAALYAFIHPIAWPSEIENIRDELGTLIHRSSATRVWAIRHQSAIIGAMKVMPSPSLP